MPEDVDIHGLVRPVAPRSTEAGAAAAFILWMGVRVGKGGLMRPT